MITLFIPSLTKIFIKTNCCINKSSMIIIKEYFYFEIYELIDKIVLILITFIFFPTK